MRSQRLQSVWDVAARQHGVIARGQLLGLGYTAKQIRRRLENRRLHSLHRGVFAVGRPEVSREGRWLAAVLACGKGALLSHRSAAALWELGEWEQSRIEVTIPAGSMRKRPGLWIHRRELLLRDCVVHNGVPVTSPVRTLLDLATCLPRGRLERAVNEAANRDLVNPEGLRAALEDYAGRRGVRQLRKLLDHQTFRLTRSELERRFLPLARDAGLPDLEAGARLNGFEVDFYCPSLGLVIETDGLRYHRTPAQQARDRLRDQAHTAAGLTPLRFTHAQIRYEPGYVRRILRTVAGRLLDTPAAT